MSSPAGSTACQQRKNAAKACRCSVMGRAGGNRGSRVVPCFRWGGLYHRAEPACRWRPDTLSLNVPVTKCEGRRGSVFLSRFGQETDNGCKETKLLFRVRQSALPGAKADRVPRRRYWRWAPFWLLAHSACGPLRSTKAHKRLYPRFIPASRAQARPGSYS